jgi:hypothetical protein
MSPRARRILILAVLLVVVAGCAATQQSQSVEPSGFLADYSQLREGRGEQALLVYIDSQANFASYDRVIVDPITIWTRPGAEIADVPRDELQHLADYLHSALRKQLELDFTLVERPQPGALRIRMAITEARKSNVALDLASTVLPPARLLSELKNLSTGTQAFVGRVAIEVEILDAVSGERLIAAVDERAGSKRLRGSTSAWSDVYSAFDYWADVLRARLTVIRQFDAAQASQEVAPEP